MDDQRFLAKINAVNYSYICSFIRLFSNNAFKALNSSLLSSQSLH